MNAPRLQRTSAAKAGWVVGLLFFAWLAFLFAPVSREKAKDAKPIAAQPLAPGLAKNPDWDGLPELFAVWSGSAEWENGRTQFAYWHPGNRSYSYLFEATRTDGNIRFRSLTKKEAFASREFREDGSYSRTDSGPYDAGAAKVAFENESPTHPFVFFRLIKIPSPVGQPTQPHLDGMDQTVKPDPVEIRIAPPPSPKLDAKTPSVPDDPTKK